MGKRKFSSKTMRKNSSRARQKIYQNLKKSFRNKLMKKLDKQRTSRRTLESKLLNS
jgi:hypothetical protein